MRKLPPFALASALLIALGNVYALGGCGDDGGGADDSSADDGAGDDGGDDGDDGDDDGSTDDGSDGDGGTGAGGSSGSGSAVCPGVAYTRVDDPGTAICFNGPSSFECGWGNGNPAVDGTWIEGEHDPARAELTLRFPRSPTDPQTDPFVFQILYPNGGDDTLVLEYMQSRAGDYEKRPSWAAAAAGDQGVCRGDSVDPGGNGTCKGPCASSSDCSIGEECLDTDSGRICMPAECTACFDRFVTCFSDADTCEFSECGEPDPDASDTCLQPCDLEEPACNEGEACVDTTDGIICVPEECLPCWEGGLLCSPDPVTCGEATCR